jgi:ADP-dependent NAD(P)H-hydrate dehydratase / NAD(P)H-hydrate epimerase
MIEKKVISSYEMVRIESLACEKGFKEIDFMEKAGEEIAKHIDCIIKKNKISKKTVYLLIGKGNNGGDCFVTGRHLISIGYKVIAYMLFDKQECSLLCQEQYENFKKNNGRVVKKTSLDDLEFEKDSIVVDGILGTGFKGSLDGFLLEVVKKINSLKLIVIAIDIPSGVDGNTGDVATDAIKAYQTIYLELPKIGLFFKRGWDFVGKLEKVSFGLDGEFISQAKEDFNLLDEEKILKSLPEIKRTRHKYQAGFVVGIGGSKGLEGAIKMSSLAALRSGSGIVKVFVDENIDFSDFPYEVVKENWNLEKIEDIATVCNKAQSVFLGPGIGREKKVFEFLKKLIPLIHTPCVIDADALYFFSKHPEIAYPEKTILTPHKKEMQRLLDTQEDDIIVKTLEYSKQKNVIVVLKGAPTIIFYPDKKPVIVPYGSPGMATAGSGDVLTGIIAALISQKVPLEEASLLGVYIHALTGEKAEKKLTSYSVIASDMINLLPEIFKKLVKELNRK